MVKAFGDKVIVTDLQHGVKKTNTGIYIPDDNGKLHGIHPRWAKVYDVGEKRTDVKKGQWVLCDHGKWSRGFMAEDEEGNIRTYWYLVDYDTILAVSDSEEEPEAVY